MHPLGASTQMCKFALRAPVSICPSAPSASALMTCNHLVSRLNNVGSPPAVCFGLGTEPAPWVEHENIVAITELCFIVATLAAAGNLSQSRGLTLVCPAGLSLSGLVQRPISKSSSEALLHGTRQRIESCRSSRQAVFPRCQAHVLSSIPPFPPSHDGPPTVSAPPFRRHTEYRLQSDSNESNRVFRACQTSLSVGVVPVPGRRCSVQMHARLEGGST